MMKAVTTSPFFASLPGPARMLLVDTLVTSLAQETVWSPLSPQGTFVHMAKMSKFVHSFTSVHVFYARYIFGPLHMHAVVKTFVHKRVNALMH